MREIVEKRIIISAMFRTVYLEMGNIENGFARESPQLAYEGDHLQAFSISMISDGINPKSCWSILIV